MSRFYGLLCIVNYRNTARFANDTHFISVDTSYDISAASLQLPADHDARAQASVVRTLRVLIAASSARRLDGPRLAVT